MRTSFTKWFWKISGYRSLYFIILIAVGISIYHNSLIGILFAALIATVATIGVLLHWRKLTKMWDKREKEKEENEQKNVQS